MHGTADDHTEAGTTDETTDETATENGRTAVPLADAAPRAAGPVLRTFRTGADLPLLVLPDERRDDRLPRGGDDTA